MPLYEEPTVIPTDTSTEYTPIRPRPGERSDGGFKGNLIDTRKRNVRSLLRYVEGEKWNIVYYRQLLGGDSEPVSYQPNQLNVYQQYEKIVNYPLRVDSDLSSNQDSETLQITVIGSGTLYDGIVPNVGDVFVADSGDGRDSLFTVNKFERKTILLDTCYTISYALIDHFNEDTKCKIDARVVRTLYYSDEYVGSGRGPLLSEVELHDYRKCMFLVSDIASYYYRTFMDLDSRLYLAPIDDKRTYDPYLSIALDKILSRDHCNCVEMPRVATLDQKVEYLPTVWGWLLTGTKTGLTILNTAAERISSAKYYIELLYSGIYMDKVQYVLLVDKNGPIVDPLIEEGDSISVPIIYPIDLYVSYIFSPFFYQGHRERMSFLEKIVDDYLTEKPINASDLITLYDDSNNWEPLEKFYYLPILYLLLRVFLRRHL